MIKRKSFEIQLNTNGNIWIKKNIVLKLYDYLLSFLVLSTNFLSRNNQNCKIYYVLILEWQFLLTLISFWCGSSNEEKDFHVVVSKQVNLWLCYVILSGESNRLFKTHAGSLNGTFRSEIRVLWTYTGSTPLRILQRLGPIVIANGKN